MSSCNVLTTKIPSIGAKKMGNISTAPIFLIMAWAHNTPYATKKAPVKILSIMGIAFLAKLREERKFAFSSYIFL